jgi:hypothetical protein
MWIPPGERAVVQVKLQQQARDAQVREAESAIVAIKVL